MGCATPGCGGGGMKMSGKSSSHSKSMSKTSGTKMSGGSRGGRAGAYSSHSGNFGQPKVRMSFGSRNR